MTNLIRRRDPFSSSAQIFEDIFKEATQTVEKPGGEKSKQEPSKRASAPPPAQTKPTASLPAQTKQVVRPPAQSKPTRTPTKNSQEDTKPAKKAAQPRREEPKPRPPEKPASKFSPLKVVLLVVLLAVLAGALVNHLGVFDVSTLSDLLGLGKKEPVPPVVKKQVPKAQAASEPASKKPGDSVALTKKEEPSASVQGKEAASRVETAKPTAPAADPRASSDQSSNACPAGPGYGGETSTPGSSPAGASEKGNSSCCDSSESAGNCPRFSAIISRSPSAQLQGRQTGDSSAHSAGKIFEYCYPCPS